MSGEIITKPCVNCGRIMKIQVDRGYSFCGECGTKNALEKSAVRMVPLTCTSCGGNMEVDPDRDFAFCTYCGAKNIISDDNKKTFVYKHEDRAEVMRMQLEKEKYEREKKLDDEFIAKQEAKYRKSIKVLIPSCVVFFIIIALIQIFESLNLDNGFLVFLLVMSFIELDIVFIILMDSLNKKRKK